MKNILIEIINDIEEYQYLIIVKSNRGIIFDLEEIIDYFKQNNIYDTNFIIDYLLVVGDKDNRFLFGEYLDGDIDYKSLQEKQISYDSEIRIKSMEYFKLDKKLIENSV